jgi:lactate permease
LRDWASARSSASTPIFSQRLVHAFWEDKVMFHQIEAPVGGSLPLSFLVAVVPLAAVLVLLGVVRRPAWQASLAGIGVALALAVGVWKMPVGLALNSLASGATFALWPVMWIVFNALILYNITVVSGRFAAFRAWMLDNLPNDRRVVLVVIGFAFGCLLEGISGFGTPVAITSALLISLGFAPLDALTYTLIFNTAPVAFGALGAPITTLGAVTQIHDVTLGAMIGRQVPFIALLLPFYVVFLFGGWRAVRVLQLAWLLTDRRAVFHDVAGRDLAVPEGLASAGGPCLRARPAGPGRKA